MGDSSKQHFGYESRTEEQRLSMAVSEESNNSSADDAAAASDEGSVELHLPRRRRRRRQFIHSDLEHSAANRESMASASSSSRPASTPGNFPDINHWLPPAVRAVDRRSLPVEVEGKEDSKSMKDKIDVWISRLDRLISGSSETDQSFEFYDITPEAFSSQDTLISSGSSTPTTEPLEDEDEDDDDVVKQRVASSYQSLDEVLRGTVCQSTFDSKDCLVWRTLPPEEEVEKPFQPSRPTAVQQKQTLPSPKVKYRKGTVCSDISQACEILNTRYKMEGIAVRTPVMTWSKWNVSQMVRGPHVKSPIWNPTLKRKWDRPDSIVFQELNKEITRRNEELEEIVRQKTETHQHRPAPSHLPSPLNHPPPPPTSSIPPSSFSTPLPTSPSNPPRSVDNPLDPFDLYAPLPPCPQLDPSANPHMEVHRSYFTTPLISPQSTSRIDPGVLQHPSHATMTTDDAEDEAPPSPTSAAGAATASSRSSSSSSSGMGLLRRMVKSVWNVFVGDRGCSSSSSGDGSNSRKSSK